MIHHLSPRVRRASISRSLTYVVNHWLQISLKSVAWFFLNIACKRCLFLHDILMFNTNNVLNDLPSRKVVPPTPEPSTTPSGGFSSGSAVKNLPANAGDTGSVPGLGRSPGQRIGKPLQYSCLGNPMDRGAWQVTVHGVAKIQTQLKQLSMHAHMWSLS